MRNLLDLTPEAAIAETNLVGIIDGRPFGINGFVGKTVAGETMSFLVDDGVIISVQKNGIIVEYNGPERTKIEEYEMEDE